MWGVRLWACIAPLSEWGSDDIRMVANWVVLDSVEKSKKGIWSYKTLVLAYRERGKSSKSGLKYRKLTIFMKLLLGDFCLTNA